MENNSKPTRSQMLRSWFKVPGKTFEVKTQIAALGGIFDAGSASWYVPPSQARAALALTHLMPIERRAWEMALLPDANPNPRRVTLDTITDSREASFFEPAYNEAILAVESGRIA